MSYTKAQKNEINFETLENELGMPVYIKPPNLGSSVGISKVSRRDELQKAIDEAFSFDKKVLIESNIVGRELECAVLGNENPKASPVGEVVTVGEEHTFYSYDAKYIDANGSVTVIPAEIDPKIQERIQKVAIQTYKALECEGLARVDVFLNANNDIYVNEVNTLPGFTNISMYPKLWEAVGLSYADLLTQLIELAVQRHQEENSIRTTL